MIRTKLDRQLWQYMTPYHREFARKGTCINLTADFLPEDVPTRFVFVCIHDAIYEYADTENIEYEVVFENFLKLFYEDGVFKATQHPTKHTSVPFNLPSAIIRTRAYKSLPLKYQKLVLSKVDKSFEHISELVIC